MKETVHYVSRYFEEMKDVAKLQWKSFVVALALLALLYWGSLTWPPGWLTYSLISVPSLIVALTALARVNDLGPEKMSRRWQVRRVGLIMAGAGSVMLLATPFLDQPAFPTWRAVIVMWGFALTWLTTPGHPPWDYYITGKYRFLTHDPATPRSPLQRFAGRITGQHSVDELMRRQAEWEKEQKRRRGDGDGP